MEKITKITLFLIFIFAGWTLSAQVLITDEVIEMPSTIDPNAILEMRTTNTESPGGLLIPKVDFVFTGGEVILENMESPTDGLIVFNKGANVDKGIWYYDAGLSRWVIFSNANSAFSASIDNFAEYYQYDDAGYDMNLSTASWLPWSTASYDEFAMGTKFTPRDNYMVDVGGGNMKPSDVLIAEESGIYEVIMYAVIDRGGTNLAVESVLHINNVAQNKLRSLAFLQSDNSYRSISANGIIQVEAGDVIDLRFKARVASSKIKVYNINLTLEKIGE